MTCQFFVIIYFSYNIFTFVCFVYNPFSTIAYFFCQANRYSPLVYYITLIGNI